VWSIIAPLASAGGSLLFGVERGRGRGGWWLVANGGGRGFTTKGTKITKMGEWAQRAEISEELGGVECALASTRGWGAIHSGLRGLSRYRHRRGDDGGLGGMEGHLTFQVRRITLI